MDIKTTFPYGKIVPEVYVKQLTGFVNDNWVCHLKKTLYGPE